MIRIQVKYGFTLAEILVTLTIIGIVAALTIPGLLQNIQKQQYFSSFKRAYSDLSQATNLIMEENGGSMAWDFTGSNTYANVFGRKMQFVKLCLANQNPGECFASDWKTLHGADGWVNPDTFNRAVLSNGSSILFRTLNWSCTNALYVRDGVNEGCGYIYVDINGLKGPNRAGRDIYEFDLTKYNGIVPGGALGTSSAANTTRCDTASNNFMNGQNCGARLLSEGEMNY